MHSKTSRSKTEDGAPVVEPKKKQNAVWTTKFSEDGKYLAVGGKDGVVRGENSYPRYRKRKLPRADLSRTPAVWEVLSTPEDRATTMQPTSPLDGAFAQDPSSSAPSSGAAPPPTIVTGSGKKKGTPRRRAPACLLPVFASHPVREYIGHDADVLDLSWSKVSKRVIGRRTRRATPTDRILAASSEQLSLVVVDGQDGPTLARLAGRVFVCLSAPRLCHLDCVPSQR